MSTKFYGDTQLMGYGADIEEDVRIIRDIEHKAREVRNQLDRLEERWHKRTDKLQRRRGVKVVVCYDFQDCLC